MRGAITRRTLTKWGIIDCLIVGMINYLGFLMVTNQNMPILEDEAFRYWVGYMDAHALLINTLSSLSFVLPVIICVLYFLICSDEKVPCRLINMPTSYALIGSFGWIFSLVIECFFLFTIWITTGISMHTIGVSSFLNMIQCSIFISTLAFMCLNAIHRFVVLPKYFPGGNLDQYPGVKNISTTAVIAVFYMSVGIFPVFFVASEFRNYSIINQFEVDKSVLIMLGVIIALDIVLMLQMASYFGRPLKKIREATEDIKLEQFDKPIELVSNDDFGILADSFNDMSSAIAEKNAHIASIQESIIRGMAVMIESRDNSTGGHINRTSECVRVFARRMQASPQFDISDSFVKNIIKAAPMHDLGKIAIDDAILRKPGKFTPEEFEIMKKHAEAGAGIVGEVLKESDEEFRLIAENVAHYHHEKWDGSGYPVGLAGEDIPYEARIMALADVFDALVSKRCYKESMDYDKAFAIIESSLGTHFDPVLGKFFISCRQELESLYDSLPE